MSTNILKPFISILQASLTCAGLILGASFDDYPEKERQRRTQEIRAKLIQKNSIHLKVKGEQNYENLD